MKKFLFIALAAATVVACNKGDKDVTANDAVVEITTATRGEVANADGAGTTTIAVPAAEEFAVTIDGNGRNLTWETLAEYNAALAKGLTFVSGINYTITLTHGELGVEGYNKPYFKGSNTVKTNGYGLSTNVNIECVLTNSIVAIETTTNFNGYFPKAKFTVNGVEWNPESEEFLFMNAGEATIVCEAVRQADMASGTVTTMTTRVALKPTTRHTVKFDLSSAGNAYIDVTFDDEIVKQIPIDTELNENA